MKIQIEAELSNYIESLHYDRNSIQELLLMAAKQGLKDTDAYNAWMKDYLGKSKEYEIAKATLEREFIIPAVGNAAVDWVLDFSTATVTVTPRWGTAVAGGGSNGVEYTAMTNLDDVATDESLSYQWQQSATGDEWVDMEGQTSSTFWASSANPKPCSWLYRCVVTASKDDVPLKTITSEPVGFVSRPKVPTGLAASSVTAAAANLSWTNGLNADDGLSYRVFWRASGAADWQSANTGREASYALNGLMPATTYEWYVQVMNDGAPSVRSAASMFVTQSLSPDTVLTRVVVSPVDQAVEAGEQATFAAYTNVDDMASATRTYKWETCDLGKDPDDPTTSWTEVAGGTATGNAITLPENTDGYVRCTVTYAPPVNAFAPLSSNPVTSENKPRVRIAPTLPSNLEVDADALGQTSARLSWNGDESRTVFDVVYGHGETALARAARAAGCRFFDGAGMLVGQAVVTVGILRDITGEAALDIPEDELFRLMADAAGFNLA